MIVINIPNIPPIIPNLFIDLFLIEVKKPINAQIKIKGKIITNSIWIIASEDKFPIKKIIPKINPINNLIIAPFCQPFKLSQNFLGLPFFLKYKPTPILKQKDIIIYKHVCPLKNNSGLGIRDKFNTKKALILQ